MPIIGFERFGLSVATILLRCVLKGVYLSYLHKMIVFKQCVAGGRFRGAGEPHENLIRRNGLIHNNIAIVEKPVLVDCRLNTCS